MNAPEPIPFKSEWPVPDARFLKAERPEPPAPPLDDVFSPRWAGLRPTSDRLRETLFDVVGARIEGARVLDGCAGTGAVGIEALSRGAEHVLFIEPLHGVTFARRPHRRKRSLHVPGFYGSCSQH